MKTGMSLPELSTEIKRQAAAKKDYIAPVARLKAVATVEKGAPIFGLNLEGMGGFFPTTQLANQQLATYTGIPTPYFRRMAEQAPGLLSVNVNRWLDDLGQKGDQRLVRCLDGNLRALLSDRFPRAYDNYAMANVILPMVQELNLTVVSADITETKLYIKAIDASKMTTLKLGQVLGRGHDRIDEVAPGLLASNSEVGQGALCLESGVYTLKCTNMANFGSKVRRMHLGSKADTSADVVALYSAATLTLTQQAFWAQARDVVRGSFSPDAFQANIERLMAAGQDPIPGTKVGEILEVFEEKFTWTKDETKSVLDFLIEGGDLSRYGLHSAVTRAAQDMPSYDRASDFERFGGQIIELNRSEWHKLAA